MIGILAAWGERHGADLQRADMIAPGLSAAIAWPAERVVNGR